DSLLRPQPALSWFLTRRLANAEQAERRDAIQRAFRELYDGFARLLIEMQISKDPEEWQQTPFLVEQEYANLGTALRLALDQQASILNLYTVLDQHLDHLQDHRRGLELGELVLEQLERLPRDTMTGTRGAELVGAIDSIAKRQLAMRQFE